MKKYTRFIGLLVLLLILYLIDLKELLIRLSDINLFFLFLSIILNIPHLFFKSLRWNLLLSEQDIFYSKTESFLIYMSSLYIGFLTPGRLGEFVKVLYLRNDKKISIGAGFSSVLTDRLFDLYLLIILGFIGVWQFDILGQLSTPFIFLTVLIILSPLIILNENLIHKIIGILFKFAVLKKISGNIKDNSKAFFNGINQLISSKLLISAILTCFGYLTFFLQSYLILLSMNLSLSFLTIILFMSISNLISFIPISISGLGTRDATLIYLFSIMNLIPEYAVAYSMLVFLTFFISGGIMGAVAWLIKHLDLNQIRKN